MTDTPSEYHMKRAIEEASNVALKFTTGDALEAFANYIAKHEPEPVDPDLVLAREICGDVAERFDYPNDALNYRSGEWDYTATIKATLAALKQGREQSAIQWIKHDWSGVCPVEDGAYCAARYKNGVQQLFRRPKNIPWHVITHYALINLPEIDQ